MSNPRVYEVGHVAAMDGSTVHVGVDYDSVWIRSSGSLLNRVQAETFAQLYVRACWLAGQQDTYTWGLPGPRSLAGPTTTIPTTRRDQPSALGPVRRSVPDPPQGGRAH